MDTYLNAVVHYLITQSWQIAALTVAVAVANLALRRHSAHVRYLLWLIVLAKCLVPPVYVVPLQVLPQRAPHTRPVPSQASERLGEPLDVAPPIRHAASPVPAAEPLRFLPETQVKDRRLSRCGWLGILWMSGAGICASVNLLRAWRGRRWLRRNRRALPAAVESDTAGLLAPYGVRRLPKIWTMPGIGQPFVWGPWRGSIYLPDSFLALDSREHRQDVLAHELSHVLRFDPLVNLLQVFAQVLFWFHPLVWWANRKIRQEREKCCDEMAVAHLQAEPKDYSRALVEALSLQPQSNRLVPSLAIAGPARHIEERIKTMLRPGKRFYRRPSLPAKMIAVTLALVAVPTTWALANRPPAGNQEGDMNAKIAQLKLGVSTKQDAIQLFGKPFLYIWKDQTFQENNLPSTYVAVFPNAPYIVFQDGVIDEIRFETQDCGYAFRDRIRIGSSLEDVLAVLAPPRETVVGEGIGWKDGVLYKDADGRKGRCYYLSAQDHVRMFFEDYRVAALYLTSEEGAGETPQRAQVDKTLTVKKTLAVFDDCRGTDLSQLDLSDKKGVLTTLWLNQEVKWPAKEKMPSDFRPDDLFQSAMNPGLGVRQLHARGITGKGVNVGIIDQPLSPDHPEFAGKIAAYHDVGCNSDMSMHGPAVASLLVGTQCGTAPGARLYFVAAPSWSLDAAYKAKALDWLVEQNKSLPAGQKIRVISVSCAPGQSSWKNHEMWGEACQRAEAQGILVLDCAGFLGPCWIDANEPENVAKCTPGFPGRSMTRGSSPDEVLTPTSPRTTAEGWSTYQYTGRGGLSWGIPYAAGVLAMGWQVRPDLPAERMKALLLASGREVANGHRIIDPQHFIRQVQAAK
jgi:serine protease AprX